MKLQSRKLGACRRQLVVFCCCLASSSHPAQLAPFYLLEAGLRRIFDVQGLFPHPPPPPEAVNPVS